MAYGNRSYGGGSGNQPSTRPLAASSAGNATVAASLGGGSTASAVVNSLLGYTFAPSGGSRVFGTQTIPLGFTPTAGNSLLVVLSDHHGAVVSLSGQGATWSQVLSREPTNDGFPTALIAWGDTVTSPASSLSLNLNGSFGTYAGTISVYEISGTPRGSTIYQSHTQSAQTTSSSPSITGVTPEASRDIPVIVLTVTGTTSTQATLSGVTKTYSTGSATGWTEETTGPISPASGDGTDSLSGLSDFRLNPTPGTTYNVSDTLTASNNWIMVSALIGGSSAARSVGSATTAGTLSAVSSLVNMTATGAGASTALASSLSTSFDSLTNRPKSITDGFTRADSGTVGTTDDGGATWQQEPFSASGYNISADQLLWSVGGGIGVTFCRVALPVSTRDYMVQATQITHGSPVGIGPCLKGAMATDTTGDEGYALIATTPTAYACRRNGVTVTPTSGSATGGYSGTPTFAVSVRGNVVQYLINGSVVCTFTDSSPLTGLWAGFTAFGSNTSSAWDAFSLTPLFAGTGGVATASGTLSVNYAISSSGTTDIEDTFNTGAGTLDGRRTEVGNTVWTSRTFSGAVGGITVSGSKAIADTGVGSNITPTAWVDVGSRAIAIQAAWVGASDGGSANGWLLLQCGSSDYESRSTDGYALQITDGATGGSNALELWAGSTVVVTVSNSIFPQSGTFKMVSDGKAKPTISVFKNGTLQFSWTDTVANRFSSTRAGIAFSATFAGESWDSVVITAPGGNATVTADMLALDFLTTNPAGRAAISGALNNNGFFAATSLSGAAGATGLLGVIAPLHGSSGGVASAVGSAVLTRRLAGSVTGSAVAHAPLVEQYNLSSTSAGLAALSSALAAIYHLDVEIAGDSTVAPAEILFLVFLTSASLAGASVVAGETVTRALTSADAAGNASCSGSLSVHFTLQGAGHATAGVQAGLTVFDRLTSNLAGHATTTSTVSRRRGITGTSSGVAAVAAPVVYTPIFVSANLAGSRDRIGTLETFVDVEVVGVHATRSRIGTLQAIAGGVNVVEGATGTRDRSGQLQATSVTVTVRSVNLAGARGRSAKLIVAEYPAPHLKSGRDRSATIKPIIVTPKLIHIQGLRPGRAGEVEISLEEHDPPSNDEIAGAIRLGTGGGFFDFDNTYASVSPHEPSWPAGVAATRTLWYLYVADADGSLRVSTGPTNDGSAPYIATRLGLYTTPALDDFDYNDLTLVTAVAAVTSFDPTGAASFISQPMTAGQFFWVRVDSASSVNSADLDDTANAVFGIGPGVISWQFMPSGDIGTGVVSDLDSNGIVTPGNLVITIGNLPPDISVTFVVDGDDPADAVDELDVSDTGTLEDASVWLPAPLSPGAHVLTGLVNGIPMFTIPFTVIGEPTDDSEGSDVSPVQILSTAVRRWVFQDPTGTNGPNGASSWTVPINPNQMNTPLRERKIETDTLVGVEGAPVIWEADPDIPLWTFSGIILDGDPADPTSHLSMLQYFADLPYPIYIIDHFNRAWTSYVESFQPVPAQSHPYRDKHTYTMTAHVLKPPEQL